MTMIMSMMQGFGASVAFYVNWLTAHPNGGF